MDCYLDGCNLSSKTGYLCWHPNGKINFDIDKYAIIFDGSFTDHNARCKDNLWKRKIFLNVFLLEEVGGRSEKH